MSVKNIIKVTNAGISPVLSITQGTDAVEFEFTISDYNIPSGSSAVAYNIQPTGNIVNQLCSIAGNIIKITPRAYFFLRGKNYMQFQITNNKKNLFSFLIEVWCSPNISEPEVSEVQDPTVVTQVLSKLGEIDLKIDSVDTRLGNRINNIVANNNPTEGNTELIDIRSGYDGTTYPSAGEAVRKQIGSLSEDIINLKPIVTGDTTFIESVYNHVKGLKSDSQGYWGANNDEATLSEMSFKVNPSSNVYAVKPIELKKGVTYKTTNARIYLSYVYDKVTKIYTRYYQNTTWKEKISTMEITPQNDSVLYMTVMTTDYESTMVVNGDIPDAYHAYGEPIGNSVTIPNLNKDSIVKHNVITVKKDGSGDFTKVYDAVNSITDANKYNIYDIHIYEGVYDVIDEVFGTDEYAKTEGIVLPPYVNLIGIGQRDNIVLKAEFPNSVSTEVSTEFSTINVDGSNDLENITFIAYNCRYACHDDDGNAEKSRNFIRNVKNCRFWHKGCYTDDGSVWKWCKAYAQGLSSGSVSNFEYCEFQTDVNVKGNCAWSSHGREDMEKPSYITHKNCNFINTHFDLCASTNGLNDHVEEYVKYIGCEFTRSVGTGNNVEINKEKFESDGVYFNAYGICNKNCYAGTGIYASGASNKLHFFANDND